MLQSVEADYYPQLEQRYRSKLAQFPFDYVIGSVHIVVPRATVFRTQNWIGRSDEEIIMLKERYYRYIQGSIRSGMYDIIGHMDALKVSYQKYVDTLPSPSFATFADIPTTEVDSTLKLLAESEQIIEVNSAFSYNFSNGTANWYPSHELLERACHYGVRVTFGSDAHDPYHVAWQHEEVKAALRDIGYKEWYFFRGRKPVACPF